MGVMIMGEMNDNLSTKEKLKQKLMYMYAIFAQRDKISDGIANANAMSIDADDFEEVYVAALDDPNFKNIEDGQYYNAAAAEEYKTLVHQRKVLEDYLGNLRQRIQNLKQEKTTYSFLNTLLFQSSKLVAVIMWFLLYQVGRLLWTLVVILQARAAGVVNVRVLGILWYTDMPNITTLLFMIVVGTLLTTGAWWTYYKVKTSQINKDLKKTTYTVTEQEAAYEQKTERLTTLRPTIAAMKEEIDATKAWNQAHQAEVNRQNEAKADEAYRMNLEARQEIIDTKKAFKKEQLEAWARIESDFKADAEIKEAIMYWPKNLQTVDDVAGMYDLVITNQVTTEQEMFNLWQTYEHQGRLEEGVGNIISAVDAVKTEISDRLREVNASIKQGFSDVNSTLETGFDEMSRNMNKMQKQNAERNAKLDSMDQSMKTGLNHLSNMENSIDAVKNMTRVQTQTLQGMAANMQEEHDEFEESMKRRKKKYGY